MAQNANFSPEEHEEGLPKFEILGENEFLEKGKKKKERNFIYVSSRSSAEALIGDTVN